MLTDIEIAHRAKLKPIEEIAEKSILQRYSKKELNSIVLKVAHHRFKNIINKRFFRCGKAAICINWGRKR